MELKSRYLYWAVKNGLKYAFPQLEANLRCDVVVVGAGITGALNADEVARHGHDVAVPDQGTVCWGSTSASTALLQYEIDTHAIDRVLRHGQAAVLLAYQSCLRSVSEVGSVAHGVGDVDVATCESLYYASSRADHPRLADECAWRKQHGCPVCRLNRAALKDAYGQTAPAAILSLVAARVDPYRLVSRLLRRRRRQGTGMFDRTQVKTITAMTRSVQTTTESGLSIRAQRAVIASGCEAQYWLRQRVAKNHSIYANISGPVDRAGLGWMASALLWETSRPYLYLRCTGDGRLLLGGEDDDHDIPARRDRLVDRKAARLQRKVARLLPHRQARPAFAWAGTFAETSDGLPLFGRHPKYGPHVHFAMAYGGIGAGLVRAQIERRPHPVTRLFSFARSGIQ